MTKFIFVVGGVISGVGKGVALASMGKILQQYGYNITAIKIDPYINCDAGTLRPTEHGEVWVTGDGGEIDQDFGNYERFLSIDIPKKNNITTGQIYKEIISKERKGKYLGKTVQFIPHVIEEIKSRIYNSSKNFDISIIEIGGTVGDYENIPFLLAAKNIEREQKKDNVIFVLVSYMPIPSHMQEPKTKPTQQAIKSLLETGIFPDIVLCRAKDPLDYIRKKKIENYVNISSECIISAPDVANLYEVPLNFEKEELGKKILSKLNLIVKKTPDWSSWKKLINNLKNSANKINIAIVGKYLDTGNYYLQDSYISIKESVRHASAHLNAKADITWLDSKQFEKNSTETLKNYDGIIVPGGFGSSGVEGKINVIKFCRENNIPYLGLCYGMQFAVVEFARNVCNLKAHSTEVNPEIECPVINILPKQKEILKKNKYGASMRLGEYAAILNNSKVLELYKETGRLAKDLIKIEELKAHLSFRLGNLDNAKNIVLERHRHRFEVSPNFVEILEKNGLKFSGYHLSIDGTKLMEFLELPSHKFFVATQAHPEFKSSLEDPHPLFYGFLKAALDNKKDI